MGLTGLCQETFHWGLQSWKRIIHKTKNYFIFSTDGWQLLFVMVACMCLKYRMVMLTEDLK